MVTIFAMNNRVKPKLVEKSIVNNTKLNYDHISGIFCTKCEIQIKATQKEILTGSSKDHYIKASARCKNLRKKFISIL